MLFTAQSELPVAKAFYDDVKARVVRHGRAPEALSIMPGVVTVVAGSRAEAEDEIATLDRLLLPAAGLAFLSGLIGDTDLSAFPLDQPLPPLPATEGPKGRQSFVLAAAQRQGLTLRQLYRSIALTSGHRLVYGAPVDVADQLEEWHAAGACDGYNIAPAHMPGGFERFASQVVPELQRRGLVQRAYAGTTLRDNLGLARPPARRRAPEAAP